MKISVLSLTVTAVGLVLALCACTGRTADNMQPSGDTVEVVIPTQDVMQDSVIAAGDIL